MKKFTDIFLLMASVNALIFDIHQCLPYNCVTQNIRTFLDHSVLHIRLFLVDLIVRIHHSYSYGSFNIVTPIVNSP